MMRVIILAFVVCAAMTGGALADDPNNYKKMPWHLVDLWWDLGSDEDFVSYEIDFEIQGELDKDMRLYIAPIGLGKFSGQNFYGGVQTQLGRAHRKRDMNKRDKDWLHGLGTGAIFSRWGTRTLDAVRTAADGVCESAGYEGDFVSIRKPIRWHTGKYTYKLIRMDHEYSGDTVYTWVGCFVTDHRRMEDHFIGALRFEGEELELDDKIASFVELYGRAIDPDTIPVMTVTFSNIRVNGQRIDIDDCDAIYPEGVPDYAEAKAGPGQSVVIELGRRVERKSRKEKMF